MESCELLPDLTQLSAQPQRALRLCGGLGSFASSNKRKMPAIEVERLSLCSEVLSLHIHRRDAEHAEVAQRVELN